MHISRWHETWWLAYFLSPIFRFRIAEALPGPGFFFFPLDVLSRRSASLSSSETADESFDVLRGLLPFCKALREVFLESVGVSSAKPSSLSSSLLLSTATNSSSSSRRIAGREDWMLGGRLAARRRADERRREGNHVWANEGG